MKINQFDKNPKIAERRIEDSSDFPEEGNNIRTNNGNMEGKVIHVDSNMVYFKLADGRPMKTSIRNVTVIEKLADGDDEIMEDELNEISNEVLARYKQGAAAQAGEADLKGDTKKADKRFSGIIKATKKQFANDKKQSKQGVAEADGLTEDSSSSLPDVLYHGGEHLISKFKIPPFGVFFSPHKEHAEVYGDAITRAKVNASPVYLVDYDEDIDEDIIDALFDRDYRKLAKYVRLLQSKGYKALQTVTDSEMVCVFPGGDIQVLPPEQGVAEGSAHGYNVVRYYEKNGDQLKLTRWLRKEAGLEKDAPVYFDDADLVYGDKIIVPNALVNPKLKFNDLLTALTQATGGQGKQKVDGVYREQGVEEDQLNELDRKTVISYVPKRIDSAKALARTDYNKAKRITQIDIPRALTKLRDKNYGHAKKSDVEENEEINNPADTVTVDVPLLIRIMEYAKEDAKTDLDLHNAAEKLIALSKEGRTLTMDDYDTMIGDVKEGGMGGINRCAPSNDVSYQDILNDVTDKWRGDTVKVGEAVDMNQFADILGKQHTDAQAAKPKAKPVNIDFHGWTIRYRPSTGGGKTEWMVLDRRGEEKHRGVSLSNKDAVSDAQEWINSGGGTDTQSKKSVTIDFNVEFAKEFGKQFYANISNDENRPTLMISLEQSQGLKTSHIRTQKERQTEGTTKLPCISLSAAEANAAGLRPNGRYVLGPNEGDNDIMIFPLIYQSTVLGKGDVMKLGTAGLTVATSRDE